MTGRSRMMGWGAAVAIAAVGAVACAGPVAAAARHHHRTGGRALTVTPARGLAIPPDPSVAAIPNFTGSNGTTTDFEIFPDLSLGGPTGFQTPGLYSYGLAGGGLTPYQLQ